MSLNYEFFYDVATYANKHWKGCFTEKEIAVNAYNYLESFKTCIELQSTVPAIQTLLDNMQEDIKNDSKNEEAIHFLEDLKQEAAFQNILDTPYGKAGIIPANCHDCFSCHDKICSRFDCIIEDPSDICDHIHGESLYQLEYTEGDDTTMFSDTPFVLTDELIQKIQDDVSSIQELIPLLNCDEFEEIQEFFTEYRAEHQKDPDLGGFSFEHLYLENKHY